MPAFLLGTKVGMTRFYQEDGTNVPVTVVQGGPCVVTQVKTTETDGYASVQLAFGAIKPRRVAIPQIAHDFKAGADPKRWHREFRLPSDEAAQAYELGQELTVAQFEQVAFVDVTGRSKGKGFQGGMKRHNFKGQLASHGVERKHRSPGSIGGHSANLGTGPKIKKGKRMAGQMGNERVTVRSLDVVSLDPERDLMLVKGPVPGPNDGLLMIREATRLYTPKAKKAAAVAKG